MPRKHYYVILLYFLLALVVVPAAYAQSTTDLRFEDILDALAPREGTALLWDLLLYAIFFLGLVNSLLIPDKQLLPSLLNFGVIGLAVVSKLLVGDGRTIEPTDFAVLILNTGMFVLPLMIAGMVRSFSRRSQAPRALMPSIFMGLLGGVYFFLFWAVEQRGA
ncbi:MAG: hypothetical protein OHK0046_00650 [Anaerolineae bacterium]